MSKPFGIAFGAAVAVIAVLVGIGFYNTKGNHLAPTGAIGKLRTVKVTDDVTLLIVDFNVRNDSDRDMIVRTVDGTVRAGVPQLPLSWGTIQSGDEGARRGTRPPDARPDGLPAFRHPL